MTGNSKELRQRKRQIPDHADLRKRMSRLQRPSEELIREERDRIRQDQAAYSDNRPALGSNSSAVEVTNVSAHGVWLIVHDHELFMPYADFPWFKEQPVRAILNVEEVAPGHFHWPDLDVDLTKEIIQHPDRHPHVAGNT